MQIEKSINPSQISKNRTNFKYSLIENSSLVVKQSLLRKYKTPIFKNIKNKYSKIFQNLLLPETSSR